MTALTLKPWYSSPAVRFLIAGAANTIATGALVVLLSLFVPGWLAFTAAFALGIAASVVLTGRWVFQTTVSLRRGILFAAAYIAIYVTGLGVVQLVHLWGLPAAANGATVFITAPLSFLAGRFIFSTNDQREVG